MYKIIFHSHTRDRQQVFQSRSEAIYNAECWLEQCRYELGLKSADEVQEAGYWFDLERI